MEHLQRVCQASRQAVQLNPPAMDEVYRRVLHEAPEYEAQLAGAVKQALAAPRADSAAIYALVTGTLKADVDYVPTAVEEALMQGMHPDTVIDPVKRTTVLHELMSRPYPPQLQPPASGGEEAQEGEEGGGFSLQQLLDRGATPNLLDAGGNSALHLLLAGVASEKMFPDLSSAMAFHVADVEDMFGDADRVHYLDTVGRALLQAGWSLQLVNAKGNTCAKLLQLCCARLESKGAKMVDQARSLMGGEAAARLQRQLEHARGVCAQLEALGSALGPA